MEKMLKTMGEGLSDEEMNTFFDLAIDPNGPSDKIDIKRVTEILLPKLESTNLMAQRQADPSNNDNSAD